MKVKRKSNEIYHFLTYDQMKRRKDICLKLIEKPHDNRFLRQIVTTDEKLIYFRNLVSGLTEVIERNRTLNQINLKKKLCCRFFSNYEGVILFDLLPRGQTINFEYYCDLL